MVLTGPSETYREESFFVSSNLRHLLPIFGAPRLIDQFSSVAQSCPTLCNPMDCNTPGLPVHRQLPEPLKLMSIESVMPSDHLTLCRPLHLLPSIFPSIRVFPMSQFFTTGGQSIGASASASVLLMNIQD